MHIEYDYGYILRRWNIKARGCKGYSDRTLQMLMLTCHNYWIGQQSSKWASDTILLTLLTEPV